VEGLDDKKRGQKGGARKVDLKAIDAVRRLQQNPNLGEFRVHAALAQMGIHLSRRTCGRILDLNRKLYGLQKLKAGRQEKKPMPFASNRRHEYRTADVRYIDHRLGGNVYAISILENHSRAILASSVSRTQDSGAFLSRCFTGPLSATDRRRHWSRTVEASSDPTGHTPSTRLWVSARRRASGASPGTSPGSPTWKRCSTYSAGWQTGTSLWGRKLAGVGGGARGVAYELRRAEPLNPSRERGRPPLA
jgi:hypothetical protein